MKLLAIVLMLWTGVGTQAKDRLTYIARGNTYHILATSKGYHETGIASWYGAESGNITASGKRFRPEGLSAAHRTLPLGSKVRVTNLKNNKSLVLVVNDRGPALKNRLIDLSHGAARVLGVKDIARVSVEGV